MADCELSSRRSPKGSGAQDGDGRDESPAAEYVGGGEVSNENRGGERGFEGHCVSLFAGTFNLGDAAATGRTPGDQKSVLVEVKKNRAWEAYFDRAEQVTFETRPSPFGSERVQDGQVSTDPGHSSETKVAPDVGDHRVLQLRPGAFRVALGGPPEGSSIRSMLESDESSAHMPPSLFDNAVPHPDMPAFNEIYMTEASLVLTAVGPPPPLVTAQPLPFRRRKRLSIVFGVSSILMIAVAVGIAFAVVANNRPYRGEEPMTKPNNGAPPVPVASMPSTMSPVSAYASEFKQTLPEYTLNELQNTSSPQSKAFAWATSEEDLPIWRVTQRFALATFGFSTGMDTKGKWAGSSGWLNATADECSWYGCSCNEDMVIVALVLYEILEGGTLPREVGLLSSLTSLILFLDELTGIIPTEISLLKNLSELDLS
jgi:hypothetical protein